MVSEWLPMLGLMITVIFRYHHPGYQMIGFWLALYPFNLHYIFLIFPNKALIIATAIDICINQKKCRFIAILGLIIGCITNLRLEATLDRLKQCHNPICIYGWEWVIAYLIIFSLFVIESEKRTKSYFLCYHFVLIFWHLDYINYSIFILNFNYLYNNGNIRFYWASRIRKIYGYVRNRFIPSK